MISFSVIVLCSFISVRVLIGGGVCDLDDGLRLIFGVGAELMYSVCYVVSSVSAVTIIRGE